MRELKFRAWDTNTNKMVYGDTDMSVDYTYNGKNTYAIAPVLLKFKEKPLPDTYEDDGTPIYSKSYILLQYTGLKDKNGVEIYEGDIVYYHIYHDEEDYDEDMNSKEYNYQVVWTDHCYGGKIGFDLVDSNGACHEYYYGGFQPEEAEVIGNIYESPELLEDQK